MKSVVTKLRVVMLDYASKQCVCDVVNKLLLCTVGNITQNI